MFRRATMLRVVILSLLLPMGAAPALSQQAAVPAAPTVSQADPERLRCSGRRHVQIALGLPAGDRELYDVFQKDTPSQRDAQVCGAIAWGNEYELLSWLENGGVQAALLPAFVVDVLKADDPAKFGRDYFTFSAQALTAVPPRVRDLVLADRSGAPIAAPGPRLAKFYEDLKAGAPGATVHVQNHLSGGVKFLIADAARWAEGQKLAGDERNAFFEALVGAIHFAFSAPCGSDSARAGELRIAETFRSAGDSGPPEGWLATLPDDVLVVRRQVLLSAPALAGLVAKARAPVSISDPSAGLFAATLAEEQQLGEPIAAFRDANYRRYQVGQVSRRYFRFTLPELWWLLGTARQELWQPGSARAKSNVSEEKLALVLTGGGVKAAYQTRMVDYLYGKRCLFNAGMDHSDNAQEVDYVIGTSGGALLGSFVASMNQRVADVLAESVRTPPASSGARANQPARTLTEVVWKLPTPGIRSEDVFPRLDMLRYASMVMGFLILAAVAALTLAFLPQRFLNVRHHEHSAAGVCERRSRGWKEAWPWLLVLGAAPFVIIGVAGGSNVEHVPWIAGIFYMMTACIAVYSEQSLTPLAKFYWRDLHFPRWAVLVGLAGALLVTISLWPFDWMRAIAGFRSGEEGFVVVSCVGFLLIALAVHLLYWEQKQSFRCENNWRLLGALGLVMGVVMGAGGIVYALALLDAASFLELTGGYWGYFVPLVLVLSGLLMWRGQAPEPNETTYNWLQRTVGFMFSEFKSRALFGSQRRYMRFTRVALFSWVWWNMMAAPGLYGNENARGYFESAFDTYLDVRAGREASSVAPAADEEFSLTVPFVIAATSLEKGQERYFLFGAEETLVRALTPEAWLHVASDPRWVLIRNATVAELRDAAFASGSPFPVFSAHSVPVQALNTQERLIDGGFAHNTPLEAAATLGAQKVLVISSSPLHTGAPSAPCRWFSGVLSLGDLTCNLPRLLPYLWQRSQVEDVLSTRKMFVASIYPTASEAKWPFLTDFRPGVVKRLVDAADSDQDDRIGVVESWGVPEVQKAQWFDYDLRLVRSQLISMAGPSAPP